MNFKYFLTGVLFCIGALSIKPNVHANPLVDEAFKEQILKTQKIIETSTREEKGKLLKDLAILYLKDQEQERAFETFIQAIAAIQPIATVSDPNSQMQKVYEEALAVYLDRNTGEPLEVAVQIIRKYASYVKADNQPNPLWYLVALSHANMGNYIDFFELFYRTYAVQPQSFLADKTQAILHVKVFERTRSVTQRELLRQTISNHLKNAVEKEPYDISLYKLQITFCPSELKTEMVSRCLNKIIESNIIIPRGEIQFYVQHAVDTKQKALAQQFIVKAREWHKSSRIIDIAQKFLDASPSTQWR